MQRWLPTALMVLLLIGFRIQGSLMPGALPNFQPLPAMLLCGIIFLQGAQKWSIPLLAWLLTDPLTSLLQGHSITGWHHLEILLGLGATTAIALWIRHYRSFASLLGGAAAAAISFYFLSNLVSFVVDPLYPKSLEGFIQSQWSGPVGYGPTWVFLRNLLAANLLFTSLFVLARRTLPTCQPIPSQVIAR